MSAIRTRLCWEGVTEIMTPTRAMSIEVAISLPICPVAMRNGVILGPCSDCRGWLHGTRSVGPPADLAIWHLAVRRDV